MKIAFVYDRVNKIGGAERVLTALHELWPEAPLFTSVYDRKNAQWASEFVVYTTFLQHIPFAKKHHEWFAWLTPFAFNSLSLDTFDVVLSITSAEAKNIITKPDTLHICYCLTPTRYLWSGTSLYKKNTGFGFLHHIVSKIFSELLPKLRSWDMIASFRPDQYVAISDRVLQRIKTYYTHNGVSVIFPPVNTDIFVPKHTIKSSQEYYLLVSRLVPYKRSDIVVQACTELEKNLIVIGSGAEKKHLKKIAGPTVRFIDGDLTDTELLEYYQQCRAFLFAGDEDFGLVAAEAQSCGIPVIAYKQSGIAEIVIDKKTGILFDHQSVSDLKKALHHFETMKWNPNTIRKNALRFSKRSFQNNIRILIEEEYRTFQKTL
jgi:glycosyltransferase involved in cell wall biosynthesis